MNGEHDEHRPDPADALLDRAFAALRETTEGAPDDGRGTRARVLLAAAAARRTRTRWTYAAFAMAATFVTMTAWAAATGRLPRVLDALTGGANESAPRPPAPAPVGPRTAPTADPAPVAAPTPAAPEPLRATASAADTAPTMPSAPPPAAPASPKPAASADAQEDALYTAAHRAHFVDRQPARALDAWDAYLAAYPQGRYALESRYNRGLDLVRLGREDEARAALEPFARGDFKGYRRAEARAVLDALR